MYIVPQISCYNKMPSTNQTILLPADAYEGGRETCSMLSSATDSGITSFLLTHLLCQPSNSNVLYLISLSAIRTDPLYIPYAGGDRFQSFYGANAVNIKLFFIIPIKKTFPIRRAMDDCPPAHVRFQLNWPPLLERIGIFEGDFAPHNRVQ